MRVPTVFKQRAFRGVAALTARRAAHLLPDARLGGPMPWVIAIMVALTTLAAGAALALPICAGNARSALDGGATVQIVSADRADRESQARHVTEPALAGMQRHCRAVERVPQDKSRSAGRTMAWASQAGSDAVPLPALSMFN